MTRNTRVGDITEQNFQYLRDLDNEVVMAVSVLYEKLGKKRIFKSLLCSESEREDLEKMIMNTGSSAEGTVVCRLFNDVADAYLEIDQMGIFWSFSQEDAHKVLQKIEDCPGYYNILLGEYRDVIIRSTIKCQKLRKIFEEELEQGEYMKASNIRAMVEREEREMQEDLQRNGNRGYLQIMFESYMKLLHCKRIKCEYDAEFEGPSFKLSFRFYERNTDILYFRWSLDRVAAACLPFWPDEAAEWIRRPREWPPIELIDIITAGGCHLVCKEEVAWRMSFSKAEMTLSRNRTQSMKIYYLIFKSIFYRYIRREEIEGERITSYVVKTIMNWEQEKHPPSYWEESPSDKILQNLFSKLHLGLKKRNIPGYFIPKQNILEKKSKSLLDHTSQIANDIAINPMAKIAEFVTSVDKKKIDDKMIILRDLASLSNKNSCLSRLLCCFKCLRCRCKDRD